MIVSRLRTGFLEHNPKTVLHHVVEQGPLDPTYSELKAVRRLGVIAKCLNFCANLNHHLAELRKTSSTTSANQLILQAGSLGQQVRPRNELNSVAVLVALKA
jgi:hypothetical protein